MEFMREEDRPILQQHLKEQEPVDIAPSVGLPGPVIPLHGYNRGNIFWFFNPTPAATQPPQTTAAPTTTTSPPLISEPSVTEWLTGWDSSPPSSPFVQAAWALQQQQQRQQQ